MDQERKYIITVSKQEYDVTLQQTVEELIRGIFKHTDLTLVDISLVITNPLTEVFKVVIDEISKLSDKQLNELTKSDFIKEMFIVYKNKKRCTKESCKGLTDKLYYSCWDWKEEFGRCRDCC